MSKSYVFVMNKYYNDDEIAKVSPIIENFVDNFADDNGVAKLNIKDDVTVVVKRDEGLTLHMVLDNPDHFTALPKKLARAKDFLNTFIIKMAKAVDEAATKTRVDDAISKVETKAEDDLFSYLSDTGKTPSPDADCDCDCDCKCTASATTINANSFKDLMSQLNDWLNNYLTKDILNKN